MNSIDYSTGRVFNSLEVKARNKETIFQAKWEDGADLKTAIKNKVHAEKLISLIVTELRDQYPEANIKVCEDGFITMEL